MTPVERLTFAAMELLYRDDELVTRIEQLAERRPACPGLSADVPTRFVVKHGSGGDHPACHRWLREVVRVCRILGCPSLDTMLRQMVYLNEGLRPGRLRATRLRRPERDPHADSVKRPRGTINRPARDLLARRAHGAGGLVALRSLVSVHRQRRGLEARGAATWGSDRRRRGWRTLALELEVELR